MSSGVRQSPGEALEGGKFSTNSLDRPGQDRVKTSTPAWWFQRIHILNVISVSGHFQGKLIEHKIEI